MLWLFCATAYAGPEAPFLWEVQGPKAKHYLLGSVHMLPERAYPLPNALQAAYEGARTVVFESDLAELATPALQGRLLGAAREDRPGGLQAQIGKRLYDKLQQRAGALGMPTPVCDAFRAWFCALTIELYTMQRAGFEAQHGVDQYFYARARDDGRPIAGLESPQQQIDLFALMSDPIAAQLLAATLHESTTSSQKPEQLERLWRSGDMSALTEVVERLRKQHPDVYERLLAERNRAWVPALTGYFKQDTPAFIVVGAAHFVGPDGLLPLLKAQGYELRPQ